MSDSSQPRLPKIAQEETILPLPKKILLAGKFFISRVIHGQVVRGVARRLLPKSFRDYYRTLRQEYPPADKTRVILFTNDSSLLPHYTTRQKIETPLRPEQTTEKVSLVVTTLNQAADTQAWLESLLRQSCLPDEVVFVDRGSTDGTLGIIDKFSGSASFPIHLMNAPGVTVAEGRNRAIQRASSPIIASTEVGCIPEADWLQSLIAPLTVDENIHLSAGVHQALKGNNFQRLCAYFLTLDLVWFDPQTYLPSWRSVAMRKSLWSLTDGYPEWLFQDPAEALFAYQAKIHLGKWAFIPQAKVSWRMPVSLAGLYRVCYQEAKGYGKTGIRASFYWGKIQKLVTLAGLAGFALLAAILAPIIFGSWGWLVPLGILGLIVLLMARMLYTTSHSFGVNIISAIGFPFLRLVVNLAQWRGFAAGVRERPDAHQRQVDHYKNQLQQILTQHPDREGIIVYPPTHDWGYMFQLPQQMARQFSRRGFLYFYCTLNERTDDVIGFRQVEPNLYLCHVPFDVFSMLSQASKGESQPGSVKPILYIGSPWNRKYLSYLTEPVIIYDHYDDLAVSSGLLEDHQHLLQTADLVLVTSQRLLDNVKGVRPDTIFAPNGVDFEHFQELRPAPDETAPADLQPILAKGKPLIGYTGALSERFDYDLCFHLIRSRPNYEFVLIGASVDGSLERSGLLDANLDNAHWMGIKPHDALIKYMWRFQVGIVPFKINEITIATTSIKVFEYMACQVPVVSVAMPESKRYPGVFIAETYEQFIEYLDVALRSKTDRTYLATIDHVARANTWGNRVETIAEMLSQSKKNLQRS
jgi:glycosyltransferase involved in cell wall biosynthesis